MSQHARRIAIVAESFGDGRDFCLEGETGIKTLHPDLYFNRSLGEMTFPSGAKGKIYSAEDPESLRGPNNYFAWCDEIAKWRYLKQTWDMLMYTMRKGQPRVVVSTTPKPYPFLKEIKARPSTVITRGRTYDNIANLSSVYIEQVITPYEGTEQGRQELNAEDLEDVAAALWRRSVIEATRVFHTPDLIRIVIGVDPAAGGAEGETGIIGAGKDDRDHGYILGDYTSSSDPSEWAPAVIRAYVELKADAIVVETNNGGKMIAHVIRQTTVEIGGVLIRGANLPIKEVWASRGKHTRAEPISMLWSQGRGHYVGAFPELEDQCCTWVPGDDSPDRMDAKVWAMTELFPNDAAGGESAIPAGVVTASQLFGGR